MDDYYFCGWRIRSEIPLPELVAWSGEDRPADIAVGFGPVPDRIDRPVHEDRYFQIAADGTLLLSVEQVGRFWIMSPSQVMIAPAPGASPDDIRLCFFGSVMGSLCHLRGLFPLHGSCVEIAGRAMIFSGHSGAGKSTTAAHLCARGHRLVADDVAAIDMGDAGPVVRPAFPRVKLTAAALESLAPEGADSEPRRMVRDKYHVDRREQFVLDPVPLRAVILLERADTPEAEGLFRVTEAPAILSRLYAEVFRPAVADAMGGPRRHFRIHTEIARSVPVYRWRRRFDFDAMDRWLDRIEHLVRPEQAA